MRAGSASLPTASKPRNGLALDAKKKPRLRFFPGRGFSFASLSSGRLHRFSAGVDDTVNGAEMTLAKQGKGGSDSLGRHHANRHNDDDEQKERKNNRPANFVLFGLVVVVVIVCHETKVRWIPSGAQGSLCFCRATLG